MVISSSRLPSSSRGPIELDLGVQVDQALVQGAEDLPRAAVHAALTLDALARRGEVVATDDDVLLRGDDRATGRRRQDVVGAQHQHPGLGLGLGRQRQVDGHLVAVEVGVEGGAHQRVDLDGLALDQDRLEGLDAQAVQRRRPVQQDRVLLDDLLQHVPDLRAAALHHPLGRLDVLGQLQVHQPLHDEGLEQLQRHQLGQAALVQAQGGAGHDDRAAGVVDPLAQQVLAEPALLALQHVRERLERAVARPGDRAAAATVVEQGVDGLLQHALLVVDDDLGRAQVEQPLQAVVAVDDPAVQVVQVRRGEAATVQLHHRAQLRRDHRDGLQDHGAGIVGAAAVVVPAVERGDDLQPLDGLLLALHGQRLAALAGVDGVAELDLLLVEVDPGDERLDGVRAHAAFEVVAVAVAQLPPQQLVVDDLAAVQAAELVPGALDQLELLLAPLADHRHVALDGLLAVLDLVVLGALGLQ